MKYTSFFVLGLVIFFVSSITTANALPPCSSNHDTIWNECEGVWTGTDGGEYSGTWKNDKRHGQGTITWPNGQRNIGAWVNDRRHGHGTHTRPDGLKYVGEFRNDHPHGEGMWTWTDGQEYVGTFE